MFASETAEDRIVHKLLADGVLSAPGLAAHQREAELLGVSLLEILQRNDLLSETDLAQAIAELHGVRFLDLTRRVPNRAWALTLAENIARTKNCLVFGEVQGQLVAAVADPVDPSVRAALSERYQRPLQFVVSPRYQLIEIMDDIYGNARAGGARVASMLPSASVAATTSAAGLNISEQLDSIIDEAVDRRASDIHIEPEGDRLRVRFRVDGRLLEARAYPLEITAPMISRVKVLSLLDITERRKPQDGRFSHRSFEQEIDVRVAVIPAARGERVTLRLLSKDRSRLTLENLGMGAEVRQAFERLIHRSHGIVLLTGPTGSGKSTTLYAALQCINSVDKHIITVEDPVEYQVPGVNQVAVDAEFGVGFAQALRSILRHDPDVIMVGEIRDQETAHLALEASLTGHLVLATLHTNSAVGAVTRLLDMGCEPYLIASSLIGVMAQRLVRKICTNCRRSIPANEVERKLMGISQERSGVEIFRGPGCSRCLRTGYFDRVGIFELVTFDTGLGKLVMEKATTEAMHKHAVAHGAITLRDDAVAKVRAGLTTLEETLRVTRLDT